MRQRIGHMVWIALVALIAGVVTLFALWAIAEIVEVGVVPERIAEPTESRS